MCATAKKKAPLRGLPVASQRLLINQTQGQGFVTSSHELTAGFAHPILSHAHAVASHASVGIHSETALTDAADFGAEVAHAQFAGLAFGEFLTVLQVREHTEGLGFGIDVFHRITFLKNGCTVQRVVNIAGADYGVNCFGEIPA